MAPGRSRPSSRSYGNRFARFADALVAARDRRNVKIVLFTSCHRRRGSNDVDSQPGPRAGAKPGRTLLVDADLTGPMVARARFTGRDGPGRRGDRGAGAGRRAGRRGRRPSGGPSASRSGPKPAAFPRRPGLVLHDGAAPPRLRPRPARRRADPRGAQRQAPDRSVDAAVLVENRSLTGDRAAPSARRGARAPAESRCSASRKRLWEAGSERTSVFRRAHGLAPRSEKAATSRVRVRARVTPARDREPRRGAGRHVRTNPPFDQDSRSRAVYEEHFGLNRRPFGETAEPSAWISLPSRETAIRRPGTGSNRARGRSSSSAVGIGQDPARAVDRRPDWRPGRPSRVPGDARRRPPRVPRRRVRRRAFPGRLDGGFAPDAPALVRGHGPARRTSVARRRRGPPDRRSRHVRDHPRPPELHHDRPARSPAPDRGVSRGSCFGLPRSVLDRLAADPSSAPSPNPRPPRTFRDGSAPPAQTELRFPEESIPLLHQASDGPLDA